MLPLPGPALSAGIDPAMHLDKLLHESEANAEAAMRAIQVVANLGEEIKNPREHIGRDADAIVGDGHDGLAAFPSR